MYKSVERIVGMKKFKGDIDGKFFDSTTVYIETRLDDRNGMRRGHCTNEFNAGKSETFDRLATLELPAEFEVEWDTVTNGRRSQQIIVGMRPHRPAATSAPAAPAKPATSA